MRKLLFCLVFIFSTFLVFTSCQIVNQGDEKVADLDFTVVEERDIPDSGDSGSLPI